MKVKFSLGSFVYKGEEVSHTHINRSEEGDTVERVTTPVDVQVENVELEVEYSPQELSGVSGAMLEIFKQMRKMNREEEKFLLRKQEKESMN